MNSLIREGEYIMSAINVDKAAIQTIVDGVKAAARPLRKGVNTTGILRGASVSTTPSATSIYKSWNTYSNAIGLLAVDIIAEMQGFVLIAEAYERNDQQIQITADQLFNLYNSDPANTIPAKTADNTSTPTDFKNYHPITPPTPEPLASVETNQTVGF